MIAGASWVQYTETSPLDPDYSACTSVTVAATTPAGASTGPVTAAFGVPDGQRFGVLTNGGATDVLNPATDPASSCISNTARGANDVVILRIDLNVPAGHNCMGMDFQFLSEEWPNFVSGFNDAFIAELDSDTWSVTGTTLSAPNNFAFVSGGLPATVMSLNGQMSGPNAASSYYTANGNGGGATSSYAQTPITPAGGAHTLYLSIFDTGDQAYDTAALIDDIHTFQVPNTATCTAGIVTPPPPPPPPPPPLVVAATAGPATCAPASVTFLDQSTTAPGAIRTATWDFGDGSVVGPTTPAGPSITHVFAQAGTYSVHLAVSDSLGRTGSADMTVIVCAPPPPLPLSTGLTAMPIADGDCAPTKVVFADASQTDPVAIMTSFWDFGDGATAIVNPSHPTVGHTYFESGTYTVSLTVIDTLGRIAVATPVQVTICPPSPIENVPDADLDGIADDQDNCPDVPNERQVDGDGNGIGDLCQDDVAIGLAASPFTVRPAPDADRDGLDDVQDNCRSVPNPGQGDFDQDGLGDVCDHDADQDGVPESGGRGTDNCRLLANPDQQDRDGDGEGDACDATFDKTESAPRLVASGSDCSSCSVSSSNKLDEAGDKSMSRTLRHVPWAGLALAAAVAVAGTLGAVLLLRRTR
jgi:PKD repeat protein